MMNRITILLMPILLLLIHVGSALPLEPIIFVNKSTVDYENAKILMDDLYSSMKVNINGDNVSLIIKNINYIPATNELKIRNVNDDIIIKFQRYNNSIKYTDVEYIKHIYFKKGSIVNLSNKNYTVEDIKPSYVILKDKDGKEITTNSTFEYCGYNITVDLVSADLNNVVVDISKNGKVIDKPKLTKGNLYYIKGGSLGIEYVNCTEEGRGYLFTFKVYSSLKIEEGSVYPLNSNFIVKEIKNNEIILKYRNLNESSNIINIFNYTIAPESFYKNYVLFKIISKKIKTVAVKNTTAYMGEGIYAIKANNSVKVYYKGHIIKNHEKIYLGLVDAFNSNILDINRDIILIGGPEVNDIVNELKNMGILKVNITNRYPGKDMGIILKIKNPYTNKYIYILAGSDRWGTKAAVLAFLTEYHGENKLLVKWTNYHVVIH